MADQSPEAVISMEQPKQVVSFSNVKGLNIRLLNCTDVTINGRDVLDSFVVQDVPATFTDDQPDEEPTRLGRRRRSELLEQTDASRRRGCAASVALPPRCSFLGCRRGSHVAVSPPPR